MDHWTRTEELAFVDFVAQLLREVVEAVAMAQLDQEERLLELQESLAQPVEELAEELLASDAVDEELDRLFPQIGKDRLAEGSVYTPETEDQAESPPIARVLGLELEPSRDYDSSSDQQYVLTTEGSRRIRRAAALEAAARRLDLLLSARNRGWPRVIVDSGHVSSQITLTTYRQESPSASVRRFAPRRELAATRPVLARRQFLANESPVIAPVARSLAPLRLGVRPADDRAPQLLSSTSEVLSKVELSFKTVTT